MFLQIKTENTVQSKILIFFLFSNVLIKVEKKAAEINISALNEKFISVTATVAMVTSLGDYEPCSRASLFCVL